MSRLPVIGITCYVEPVDRRPWVGQPSAVLPRLYLDHVEAAGAIGVLLPPREDASSYTGSFTDPDGHVWEVVWMDQLHVVN